MIESAGWHPPGLGCEKPDDGQGKLSDSLAHAKGGGGWSQRRGEAAEQPALQPCARRSTPASSEHCASYAGRLMQVASHDLHIHFTAQQPAKSAWTER